MKKKCEKCGKNFIRNINYSKRQWGKARFCSRRCANLGIIRSKRRKMTKICDTCKTVYFRNKRYSDKQWKQSKCCSRNCSSKNIEANKKRREASLKNGNRPPVNIGSNNFKWKGDHVKYSGLHMWVKFYKGKPKKCEHCGETKKRLQWANVDHKYKRKLDDFITLCCSCHKIYDNKLKRSLQLTKKI